jgi:hypothetical protein
MGMTIPQSKPLLINLEVNNKAYDLPTTASPVGIDLNTGKQLYYNTGSLDWVTQETFSGSNAIFGDITGSNLRLTGNPGVIANNIGPLLISSSLGITTSGSIVFSGSRSSLGTEEVSVLVNGDIFVSGGIGTNDYLQLKPVNLLRIPTNTTASYIYTSGSTNDLYFTQYSGSFTNTTRLRWLESLMSTGLLKGGVLTTTNGTTTFNVSAGEGLIISFNASTTNDPYPTIKLVSWPVSSSIPLYYSGSAQITYVGIDSNGKVVQNITPFAQTDYQNYISLGRILHQSNAVTNGTISSPFVAYGQSTWNADFNRAFGPLKISGHFLAPSGSGTTLAITKSAGDSLVEGRNYTTDPNSPNLVLGSVEGAQLTSKIFRIYGNTSGTPTILNNGNAGYTDIEPGKYNPGNLGVTGSVGSGKFTIQRVYWFPNSVNKAFFVYYGTTEYATISEAQSSIPTDFFVEANNTAGAAILVAYLIVAYNATNLNNTSQAKILQAGLFRNNGTGGGGGGSVNPGGVDTNIQYNNASSFGGSSNLTFNSTTNTLTTTNLQVSGIVGASGSVTLGDAASDIITVTGQLTASQGLSSSNSISAAGNLFVQGNSQFTGSAYFAGNVFLGDAASDATTTTSQLTASNGIAVTGGALSSSGNISTAGNLLVQGTTRFTGSVYIGGAVGQASVNTSDTAQPILYLSGTDTRGGAGYFNFLKTSNNYSSATNRDKYFRLTSTGDIQVVNSAYASTLLELSDVGNLKIGAGSSYFGPVKESFAAKSGATGTITHDCVTSSIFYHTSPSNNWTANFTNLNLSASYATSVTMVISQSGTAYLPTAVQIEGSGQTLNWQGNTTPSGTPSRNNVVTFSILNNGGTYIVLGQLVSF